MLSAARVAGYLEEVSVLRLSKGWLGLVTVAAVGVAMGGCASGSGRQPVGFSGGSDCRSVKAELHQMDTQGVPGLIQAGSAHASAANKAKIDRYNALLEEYLGNDCQLPPST